MKETKVNHFFFKEPQFGPKGKDIKLPYKGQQSDILKRQLTSLNAKVAPWLKLNFIFFASNRIKRLSKLKCQLPVAKRSHVIYKVNCSECDEFYIGLTNRRLETRLYMNILQMKTVHCIDILS